ncbi:MAG: hypothetical protein AB1791_21305 [Chloroflexota bacterium]
MARAKSKRRKRTTSEKAFIVLSVIIALSMVLALLVSFTPSASQNNNSNPDTGQLDEYPAVVFRSLTTTGQVVARPSSTSPPL